MAPAVTASPANISSRSRLGASAGGALVGNGMDGDMITKVLRLL